MSSSSFFHVLILASTVQIGAELPKSAIPKQHFVLAQSVANGQQCQTLSGICPLLDKAGKPFQLPLGSICYCGVDAGSVIQ